MILFITGIYMHQTTRRHIQQINLNIYHSHNIKSHDYE